MEPAAKLDVSLEEKYLFKDVHQGYCEILRELDRIMEMVKKMDEVKENSDCEKIQKGCEERSAYGEESTSANGCAVKHENERNSEESFPEVVSTNTSVSNTIRDVDETSIVGIICGTEQRKDCDSDEGNDVNTSEERSSKTSPREDSSNNEEEDSELPPIDASLIEAVPELVVEQPETHLPARPCVDGPSAQVPTAITQVKTGLGNSVEAPVFNAEELLGRSALRELHDANLKTESEDQSATLKAESDVSQMLDTSENQDAAWLPQPVVDMWVNPDMVAGKPADRLVALASAAVASGAVSSVAIPPAATVVPASDSFLVGLAVNLDEEDGPRMCGEWERKEVPLDAEVPVAAKVQGLVPVQQRSQPLATAAPAPALVKECGAFQPPARAASSEWALMVEPSLFALRIRWLLVLACCGLLIGNPVRLTSPMFIGRKVTSAWIGSMKAHELYTAASSLYVCWFAIHVLTPGRITNFGACPVGAGVLCPVWNGPSILDGVMMSCSVQEVSGTVSGLLENRRSISDKRKTYAKLAGVKSDVPHFVTLSAMTKSKGSGDTYYLEMITRKSEMPADPSDDSVEIIDTESEFARGEHRRYYHGRQGYCHAVGRGRPSGVNVCYGAKTL